MKSAFEPVFNLSVPRRGSVGLRPKIFDGIIMDKSQPIKSGIISTGIYAEGRVM
jgi:hypothetical protein